MNIFGFSLTKPAQISTVQCEDNEDRIIRRDKNCWNNHSPLSSLTCVWRVREKELTIRFYRTENVVFAGTARHWQGVWLCAVSCQPNQFPVNRHACLSVSALCVGFNVSAERRRMTTTGNDSHRRAHILQTAGFNLNSVIWVRTRFPLYILKLLFFNYEKSRNCRN